MKLGDWVFYAQPGGQQIRSRICSTYSRGSLRGFCQLRTESGHSLFNIALAELEPAPPPEVRRRRAR